MSDIITHKVCRICNEDKLLYEFPNNRNRTDGKDGCCRSCNSKSTLKWQKENPEKVNSKNKIWGDKNKEKKYLYNVRYRTSNLEKIRSIQNKWAESNREKRRASVKKWQDSNPEKRAINQRNREISKLQVGGKITVDDIRELKKRYGEICLCCKRADIVLTLDHVIPISRGGANTIENAQLLCGSCNSKKGTKIIDYRSK